MFQRRKLPLAALALLAAAPLVTAEEVVLSPSRRVTEESVGASYNRLGLQHVFGVRWTRPLIRSRRPLLEGAHVSGGLSHTLTPSYMRVGAWAEVAPLSVLDVRAGLEPGAYFGTFGSLMSYGSYDAGLGNVRGATGTGARVSSVPDREAEARELRHGEHGRDGVVVVQCEWSLLLRAVP